MARYELELRNIPQEVVMRYLREAGAQNIGESDAQGDGWSATLLPLEAVRIGVMFIPRSLLIIEGDDDKVTAPYDYMRRGMMRGGG